jgi:hypothetical protein
MKKLILCTLIFINLQVFSQATFQKTYGGGLSELAYSIIQTADGGYALCGLRSIPFYYSDGYVLRLDSEGDTIWTNMAVGSSDVGDYSILQTDDQGYMIAGYWDDGLNNAREMYLEKRDTSGNSLWLYRYGAGMLDEGYCVQQTTDDGYILSGMTRSFGAGGSDMYLVKVNSIGTPEWSHTYGHSTNDYAYAVSPTNDGGYILTGKGSAGAGGTDMLLVKTDDLGNIEWSKTIGTAFNEDAYSVQQTSDGGFIAAGSTASSGGSVNLLMVKTDSLGSLLWAKTYSSLAHNYGRCVRLTSDGGYIVAGYTDNTGITSADGYVVKTDDSGNLLWSRTYGIGTWEELLYCVIETNDGGYMFSGYTNTAANGHDVYVIKTDNMGISGCNEADGLTTVNTPSLQVTNDSLSVSAGYIMYVSTPQLNVEGTFSTLCLLTNTKETALEEQLSVFPNPSDGIITVSLSDNLIEEETEVLITNTLGEVVQTSKIANGKQQVEVDFTDRTGIYFITVSGKKGIAKEKVVILN